VARRGIDFRDYLRHRDDKTGKFPRYRVKIGEGDHPEIHYLYSDSQLKELQDQLEKNTGKQLMLSEDESGEPEEPGNGNGAGFSYVEIFAAQSLDRLAAALAKKGFPIDNYEQSDTPICNVVSDDGEKQPMYSLAELIATVRKMGEKGWEIQRYKGLGEMNADQLYETTMNPDKRKLLRVVLEDAYKADELFTILMGSEVAPRRQFIEENALSVRNLDI
jgi:DNA gyrase subunit B